MYWILKECLSNLFIHENEIILSFYFIQATNKALHHSIKRLYYPVGKYYTYKYYTYNTTLIGTVFEIGNQRMEVFGVHHGRATIQWLQASKENSIQAQNILKYIYVQ